MRITNIHLEYQFAVALTEKEMQHLVKWIDIREEDEEPDSNAPEYTVYKLILGIVGLKIES